MLKPFYDYMKTTHIVRPIQKICVVQVTLPTLIFYSLNFFFSPFWSNCSSEKETGRQGMHFKGVFFLYMNPVALRDAKIVYTFGLSECNRFKRKTFVFSEYIRIILFAIISYF